MKEVIVKWGQYSIKKIEQDNMAVYVNDDIMDELKKINLKGKTVIDGGSNIGIYSLVFSDMVGDSGLVYAFEIQPLIYELGNENFILNKKENIISLNKALSCDRWQTIGFTYINYNEENISSVGVKTEPSLSGHSHCGEISTITLDSLEIQNVGLIKLDLEGHEPEALEGMWGTIDKWKPYMIIELSPSYLKGAENSIIENIKSRGYLINKLTDYNYCFKPNNLTI